LNYEEKLNSTIRGRSVSLIGNAELNRMCKIGTAAKDAAAPGAEPAAHRAALHGDIAAPANLNGDKCGNPKL
jgi:hypothetical protein